MELKILLLSCCVSIASVAGQMTVLTNSNPLIIGSSVEFKVHCIIDTNTLQDIFTIEISKNGSATGNTDKNMITVSYDKGSQTNTKTYGVLNANRPGLTVEGHVFPINTAFLKVTINAGNVTCNDAATYTCTANVWPKGGDPGTILTGSKAVTTKEGAGKIESMFVNGLIEPADSYKVNDVLKFTCRSKVGNPPVLHRWCYKKSNMQNFMGPTNLSFVDQTTVYSQIGCIYERESTFTYVVQSDDTSTIILCEDDTNQQCTMGLHKSKMTISISPPGGGNTDGQQQETASAGAGAIAGGVIGGLAALILIILLVYFFVFRRRSPGETYSTKEDGSPEGPVATEGPVYTVPDKSRGRDKHKRRDEKHGRENEAMDEPHESKPRRPSREKGGHSNVSYDHDNYSDRDGDVIGGYRGGSRGGSLQGSMDNVGLGSAV